MPGALARGLADPIFDAQRVFRVVMNALARPGSLGLLLSDLAPPPPLTPGLAAIALSLCDQDTPLWLDVALVQAPAVADYLRFHTGAPIATAPSEAAFAFVADPVACPTLDTFALGPQDYPDRSTTLVFAVEQLSAESGFILEGPGIARQASLGAAPLPRDFEQTWADNRARFPRGVDLLFAARHTARGSAAQHAHCRETLMYVAVKGGEAAIANAHRLLADVRRGDRAVPEVTVEQIAEQLALAVDRVMAEGSLYDRELAALALKQARGDLIEAVFLVRAYRTTLPRLGLQRAGRYRRHGDSPSHLGHLQGSARWPGARPDLRLHASARRFCA